MTTTEGETFSWFLFKELPGNAFGITHTVEAIICGQVSAAMRYLLTT